MTGRRVSVPSILVGTCSMVPRHHSATWSMFCRLTSTALTAKGFRVYLRSSIVCLSVFGRLLVNSKRSVVIANDDVSGRSTLDRFSYRDIDAVRGLPVV